MLLVALLCADEGIKNAKARRLVGQAIPLMRKADEVYKAWILEKIPKESLKEQLQKAIAWYDAGAAKLQAALDIEEHGGVIHRLSVAARRMQKMRFEVEFRLKPPTRPKPRPPSGTPPTPRPEDPAPNPAPKPVAPKPKPVEEEETRGSLTFDDAGPPAAPVSVDLAGATDVADEKGATKRIAATLKAHFQARRQNKLLVRHKLCRGKGTYPDGTTCEECCATGTLVNEYHFRKVFWNSYSPLLRDAEGAKAALDKFYERAKRKPNLLGAPVKSFKVAQVAYRGYWAKATVAVKTDAGTSEAVITLIGIGSQWFFFHPEADAALLPQTEG